MAWLMATKALKVAYGHAASPDKEAFNLQGHLSQAFTTLDRRKQAGRSLPPHCSSTPAK
jgi:hypothetical protein